MYGIKLIPLGLLIFLIGCSTTESIKYLQPNPPINQPAKMVDLKVNTYLLKEPSPTVIYAHGCSGLDGAYLDWKNKLNGWGYNVVMPDSNRSRGVETACSSNKVVNVTHHEKLEDILETANWIKQQPWHKGKIGVIGFSMGAQAVLNLASNGGELYPLQSNVDSTVYENQNVSAVVAYYPYCKISHKRATIPALILIGELDNWTPPTWCKAIAEENEDGNIKLQIYPGVYHSFDTYGFNGINRHGFMVKYDSKAALDAENKTREFFGQNLK